MADSIGTMALLLTTDISGFSAGMKKAQGDLGGLVSATKNLAGAIGVGLSVGAVVQGLRGMANEADRVTEAAEKLGISTTYFQQLGTVAQQNGSSIEAVSTAMAKMQNVIADAAAGAKEAKTAIGGIGLNADALIGADASVQFKTVAQHIMAIQNAAERTNAEMAIFGRGGKELELVLKKAAEGLSGVPAVSRLGIAGLNEMKSVGEGMFTRFKVGFMELAGQAAAGFLGALGVDVMAAAEAERQQKAEAQSLLVTERRIAEEKKKQEEAAKAAAEADKKRKEAANAGWDKNLGLSDQIAAERGTPKWMLDWQREAEKMRGAGVSELEIEVMGRERAAKERELAVIKAQKDEARQVAEAVRDTVSAEEEFAKAARDAHDWKERGLITEMQEAGIIGKAQDKLLKSWKEQLGEAKLGSGAIGGTQEAYQAMTRYQTELGQRETLAERLAQQQVNNGEKTNQILEELVARIGVRPPIAEMSP